jgi:organic hydroperoxide reductase OsmC/OhrA
MGHTYTATVEWVREGAAFTDKRYSRGHRWLFDGGVEVPASSSPLHVRVPFSREDAVDPEEAFVAALSSCHMLFFLDFAARSGFVVDSYRDEASGTMGRSEQGAEYVAEVRLRPATVFSGDTRPSEADIADLHHRAHAACYLANSVRTAIVIDGVEPHV